MFFNSLKSRIIFSTAGILAVSLSITILFLHYRVTDELSNAFDGNAKNLLKATLNHVETQHGSILYHKSMMLSRKKTELKTHIAIAFAFIDAVYQQYRDGQVTEELAKQYVTNELQLLRYDNGTGYFWINDATRPYPRMVMHPTMSELNGTILDNPEFNSALGRKENLFKAFVDVCLEQGEGFVDYYWPRPIQGQLTEDQPKLSYVKLFKPWGWIIGSGVYIDDIDRDVQLRIESIIRDLNLTLSRQPIGENGYLAIFDDNNRMLAHPLLAGKYVGHLKNPETGNPILDEMKMAALSNQRQFQYNWDKPGFEGEYRFAQKTFIEYYEPLGWYIYSSIYLDDFKNTTSALTKTLILFSTLFMAAAFALSLLVLRSITNPLNLLIKSIDKTDGDGIPTGVAPIKGTREIMALSGTINRMVISIMESREDLKSQRDFSFGIIDNAPFIIAGLDPDGIATYINPAGEETTGYTKEEVIGKKWWELFFPEQSYYSVKDVFNRTARGDSLDFETTMYCKNGVQKQVIWSSFTKTNKDQKASDIYWFGNDITQRKHAEENLRTLRNYLLNIINSIPSALVGIDANGTITQWNRSAHQQTGIPPDKAVGSSLEQISPNLAIDMEWVQKSIQDRETVAGIKQNQQKNGETVHRELSIFPITSENDEGALIRIDDITEKVRMEEMMIQSEKMLSVGGLAAGMAHEINNPLAAMMQTANVMAGRLINDLDLPANQKAAADAGLVPEALHRYMDERGIPRMLSNMKEAGQRISAIVNNMLSFARKSNDQVSTWDITELIDKTLELAVTDYDLKKQYDFRDIKIVKTYKEDLPHLRCEGAQLQQVLLNILRNGAQAMYESKTEHPQFTIRACLEKNQTIMRLEIEDNGPGISGENRHRIFEPFFTTKPVGVGTGLGLSVSYFIITENLGGKLTMVSQPGKGSTFIIQLPLDETKTGGDI